MALSRNKSTTDSLEHYLLKSYSLETGTIPTRKRQRIAAHKHFLLSRLRFAGANQRSFTKKLREIFNKNLSLSLQVVAQKSHCCLLLLLLLLRTARRGALSSETNGRRRRLEILRSAPLLPGRQKGGEGEDLASGF